ncbi:MAG: peptidoglycan-binding domain-containing protein [Patescibacteria group bacterium]
MKNRFKTIKILFIGMVFLFLPIVAKADYGGQTNRFFIDSSYDLNGRQELDATLLRITSKVYFYIDDAWWNSLGQSETSMLKLAIQKLGEEFDGKIYPELTATFGSEWKPGIDGDEKITVLIHPMVSQAGGYFNSGDEYSTALNPKSNKREMVYFNSQYLNSDLAKSFLAHEFVHLITFNQKNRLRGVQEEIWLNEARAEYAPTLLGYDSVGTDSNLNRRIRDFLRDPSVSFVDWENKRETYGALNLFTQYLVDHYGAGILINSLKSSFTGVNSLNFALLNKGFYQDFDQIFKDWSIAVLINDCSIGDKYCYLGSSLKNFRLIPSINFLPLTGESRLSLSETTKKWSGNWYKFIGGWGNLKIEFVGSSGVNFEVPYVSQDLAGNQSLGFFQLDDYQKGEVYISDFGRNITSVVIIPLIQDDNVKNIKTLYPFFWQASTEESQADQGSSGQSGSQNIQDVLDKISVLEKQLASLRVELQILLSAEMDSVKSCQSLNQNLSFGIRNNSVSCLQEFLKSQGDDIYPEKLVTGFFGNLTQQAIIRFQEKYASEILTPLGLEKGTGFVGPSTRVKINSMLQK